MKAKYHFEIMELDDGIVAVPVGESAELFHGVLKVNETAVAILKLLDHETTEKEIVEALLHEYNSERELISEYVHSYIEKLIAEGIVE